MSAEENADREELPAGGLNGLAGWWQSLTFG
jgi:hypothetical protein